MTSPLENSWAPSSFEILQSISTFGSSLSKSQFYDDLDMIESLEIFELEAEISPLLGRRP